MKLKCEDVLRYSPTPRSRATVARCYKEWRDQKNIPTRCDEPTCSFHTQPLKWLNNSLPIILDHKNGNKADNSPKNLQYLCPNCDSQRPTRGGKNRGRVLENAEGMYILMETGRRHYYLIPEPASLQITTYAPTIVINKQRK